MRKGRHNVAGVQKILSFHGEKIHLQAGSSADIPDVDQIQNGFWGVIADDGHDVPVAVLPKISPGPAPEEPHFSGAELIPTEPDEGIQSGRNLWCALFPQASNTTATCSVLSVWTPDPIHITSSSGTFTPTSASLARTAASVSV